jgi:hypothetical protein
MNFNYYYNNVPGIGLVRNNLIYTSLISEDKKTFVKWYHNDTAYHQGKNKVVDPKLMDEKWDREMHFLHNMAHHYPDMVPEILEVNVPERKIYLKIDGEDFWQRSFEFDGDYSKVVPDWREQILNITKAHKAHGWYKFSAHPSSYFPVDGKLKSINYFFTYSDNEPPITVNSVSSHLSEDRLADAQRIADKHGLTFDMPIDLNLFQHLVFESFRTNYPADFIEELKKIYS